MKRFKIVQHWYSPTDDMYRVCERKMFFFWSHLSSHYNIEGCEAYINNMLNDERIQREQIANTPANKVIGYV